MLSSIGLFAGKKSRSISQCRTPSTEPLLPGFLSFFKNAQILIKHKLLSSTSVRIGHGFLLPQPNVAHPSPTQCCSIPGLTANAADPLP